MSFDNRSSTREGNGGGNSDMESQPPSLCKSGCGFYGNPAFDGHCSVCYKDKVKCQMQPTATRPISPHNLPSLSDPVEEDVSASDIAISQSMNANKETSSTMPSVEAAAPTISSVTPEDKRGVSDAVQADECGAAPIETLVENTAVSSEAVETKESEAAPKEKPKKNRCHTCKKRVGLTGFQCRCNGLFCTTHRYSDMHECPFNYKEMAQQQIRKNNPVVVGQKITKI